jgi:hypothetical protein
VWGANALTGVVNIITVAAGGPGVSLTLQAGHRLQVRPLPRRRRLPPGAAHLPPPQRQLGLQVSAGYYNSDAFSRPTGTIPVIDDPREAGKKVGGATYPTDSSTGTFGTRFQNSSTSQPKFDLRLDQDFKSGGHLTYGAGVSGTEGLVHTGIGPFDIQSGSYMYYGKLNSPGRPEGERSPTCST